MNNSQTAHRWAQQNDTKDANGSNFYQRGDTIYSYGPHFPIARFTDPSTVLFTSRDYGNSTAKHKGFTRQAIPHACTVFIVSDVKAQSKDDHRRNFETIRQKALGIIEELPRLRQRKAGEIDRALALIAHANQYAAHFKIGRRIKLAGNTLEELIALRLASLQQSAKADSARIKRQREIIARERIEAQETLAKWYLGDSKFPPQSLIDGVRFRLINDGADLQSTLGAEFPADHARRAWPLLQRIRATGETWHRNGQQIHLGHFQIDRIETTGDMVAGCHRIQWSEVVRVANLLGMTTEGTEQP